MWKEFPCWIKLIGGYENEELKQDRVGENSICSDHGARKSDLGGNGLLVAPSADLGKSFP